MSNGIEKLKKRDGRLVDFDESKIAVAIHKAFQATYKPDQEDTARALAKEVVSVLEVEGVETPDVEHVQDTVERVLMDNGYVQTAKAYILYRNERSRAREMNTRLMKIYEDIAFADPGEPEGQPGSAGDINPDTAMGALYQYGSEGAKQFYQMFLLKPEHAKAHREGDLYIHDLAFYSLATASCQIGLTPLLNRGITIGKCTLPPPDDIAACAAMAAAAVHAGQNDQYGGQSIADFDYAMAVGVRKTFASLYSRCFSACLSALPDPLPLPALSPAPTLSRKAEDQAAELALFPPEHRETVRPLQQAADQWAVRETEAATLRAMSALLRELNTVQSRCGGRAPLSALHFGCDTSPEGRMATVCLLRAAGEIASQSGPLPYPVLVFRVKAGVNFQPGDSNVDLFQEACRAAENGVPIRFAFLDAHFNLQYHQKGEPSTEATYSESAMRCIADVCEDSRQQCFGRGTLSATTVNLPRMAIRAKGDIDLFFDELDDAMNLCIDQLLDRYAIQCRKKVCSFPFLMGQGIWLDSSRLSWTDEIFSVLKHGTLSMGFLGLAETLIALTGHHHGEDPHSQRLGLEIIARMRARVDEECTKTGLNFTLYATPSQALHRRLARLDAKRFGILPGITDHDAYTDSFHLPYDTSISPEARITLEGPYHALTNGGHICRVRTQSPQAIEGLLQAMAQAGVGYGCVESIR